jgi:hypothetical protein
MPQFVPGQEIGGLRQARGEGEPENPGQPAKECENAERRARSAKFRMIHGVRSLVFGNKITHFPDEQKGKDHDRGIAVGGSLMVYIPAGSNE